MCMLNSLFSKLWTCSVCTEYYHCIINKSVAIFNIYEKQCFNIYKILRFNIYETQHFKMPHVSPIPEQQRRASGMNYQQFVNYTFSDQHMGRPRTGVAFARMPEPKIDNERHEPIGAQPRRLYAGTPRYASFKGGKITIDSNIHRSKASSG